MNLIAIIGHVASGPRLKTTEQGRSVCTFTIKVSRPGTGEADYFDCTCWERQADIANEYLHVGRRVGVEGRLHQVSWDTDDGPRSRVEIVCHRVQLLGPKPGSAPVASASVDADA